MVTAKSTALSITAFHTSPRFKPFFLGQLPYLATRYVDPPGPRHWPSGLAIWRGFAPPRRSIKYLEDNHSGESITLSVYKG